MSLFSELKRRNVFKVGVAYLVMAWLLIQIIVTVEDPLYLPDFLDTAVIVLLAIGFPVALLLAWAFELTPEGVKLASAVDSAQSIAHRTGHRLNYLIIGALSLAVVLLVVDNYVLDDRLGGDSVEAAGASPATAAPPAAAPPAAASLGTAPLAAGAGPIPRSVAILPFETLSNDVDNVDFAEGVYADIFYELEKLDRLTVIGRRTMRHYENTLKSFEEIAAETNAQSVLELLVRYADNRVRINAELVRVDGPSSDVVWTEAYEEDYTSRSFFEIQTDIARNIAERLVGELSPAEQARLAEVLTDNADALSSYLRSLPHLENATQQGAASCLEPLSRAVELDPGFKEAWFRKAACHDNRALFFPATAEEERRLSIAALERVLALDADYTEAYVRLAFALAYGGNWPEAGRAYRTALDLGIPPGASGAGLFLFAVGHLREAFEDHEALFARDPENTTNASFLMVLYETLGDTRSADRMYQVGRERYESWAAGDHARLAALMGRAKRGQIDPSVVATYFRDTYSAFSPWHAELAGGYDDPEATVASLRSRIGQSLTNPFNQTDIATHAAYLGEPELALEAIGNASSLFAINLVWLWTPLFAEVRQLEGFKQYLREIGMVDVWRELGWPDLCEPAGDADFRCE